MLINIFHTQTKRIMYRDTSYSVRLNVSHNNIFLLLFAGATGLKDLTINVPHVVRSGDTVTLSCHYDLEGSSLYTIQWFFNTVEFYSYIPDRSPPLKIFETDVNIQVNVSNPSQ